MNVILDLSSEQAASLLAQLQGIPPGPNPALAYPDANGLVHVGGIAIKTTIPINLSFRPSMMAWTMGHLPGTFVFEPSNGAEVGADSRSPNGFPLIWAKDANGKAMGLPSVLWGESAYRNDGEVLDAISQSLTTPQQASANQAAWNSLYAAMKNHP